MPHCWQFPSQNLICGVARTLCVTVSSVRCLSVVLWTLTPPVTHALLFPGQTVSRPAQMTSGTVNILDPVELVRQIRLISQNPVIATGVEIHFILHPALMFDKKTDTSVSGTSVWDLFLARKACQMELSTCHCCPFPSCERFFRFDMAPEFVVTVGCSSCLF